MSKLAPFDLAADIRQMGEDDFYEGYPQSFGLRCWGPSSLALRHWVEGWEKAQLDAWCDMEAMKDKWTAEQFKRELGL